MIDKLTKEEVLHVAHLARINVSDSEIEKYQNLINQETRFFSAVCDMMLHTKVF